FPPIRISCNSWLTSRVTIPSMAYYFTSLVIRALKLLHVHTYCTSIKTGGDIAVKWYQLESHIIENRLSVKHEKGLTNQLAMQRLKQYGVNKLKTAEKESLWVLFMKQFQDFMVIILLAATLIAGMLGEFIDATAIMVIVI